jgi:hypothetical protein
MAPRIRIAALALAAFVPLTACGGGGGGDGIAPPAQATIRAPTFTTGPDERQSVTISLQNNRAAAAVQVDMLSPPEVIPAIEGIGPEGRAAGRFNAVVQNVAAGRARLLLFDPAGAQTIAAGDGPVLIVNFRVAASAPAGTSPILLENAVVVEANADAFEVTLVTGQVTVQ